ncbi:MAG TPA: VCBS repeat-containing protein, partial [Myxococcota bacterium]|nr:VCBS repeat-containing protein [Myxococcota bacterium]
DFDGDGLSDLLLRDPRSGNLVLWKMEGAQVLERLDVAHLPSPWKLQEPGDYDGDGTADLLWRDELTGQLIVWLIRAGAVASGGGLDLGSVTSDWTVAGRGDFDGDGRDDIALARPQPGVVDILLMNGKAIASRVVRNAPSDRWRLAATPDADGDGTAELVWENVDTHALAIEHMSLPGQAVALVSQPGNWRVLGAGDVDGDGRDDLLAKQSSSGEVRAWLLDGDRARPAGWSAKAGDSNWAYRGLGDFDGDGFADSVWHNPTAAAVEIWFSVPGGSDSAFVSDRPAGIQLVGDGGD